MKTTITINGMHCNSCEILLKDVLEETDGVTSANVSKTNNNAVVEFDESKVTREQLCKLIEAEKYTTA